MNDIPNQIRKNVRRQGPVSCDPAWSTLNRRISQPTAFDDFLCRNSTAFVPH